MDTTIKKIDSSHSPRGPQGQLHLASGKGVAMRLWRVEPGQMPTSERTYETVGYVVKGSAELESGGQKIRLEPGDSWLVPAGASHAYRVLEDFEVVEATSPPAHAENRNAPPGK